MKHPMKGQNTVIVEDVADYRAVIPQVVKEGDCVLEVGCHEGVTTRRIAAKVGPTGHVIGVDTGAASIELAKTGYKQYDNLEFHIGDALNISYLLKLTKRKYDLVFLDISGSRDLETLIPLMESYEFALKPRQIIVKSFRLKRLFLNCSLFEFFPTPPGVKNDPHGKGGWKEPTTTEVAPLPAPDYLPRVAKGMLPTTEEGSIDTSKVAVNAKLNKGLGEWGSGRERHAERQKANRKEKEENPELRQFNVQRNVMLCKETQQRATINKIYGNQLLEICRAARTEMKGCSKDENGISILGWSKPLGHITWKNNKKD
eukprot:TRINITY_DN18450_c0_g1_i1.p1 TRINITY_DN18450_c0_g1~~TRINITY_DN18450_c0_g1_i1.p1  ORF type:complete len:332 (+),score=66.15 TRINITY_DN18450_c0_g1_i1:53-997(+)